MEVPRVIRAWRWSDFNAWNGKDLRLRRESAGVLRLKSLLLL